MRWAREQDRGALLVGAVFAAGIALRLLFVYAYRPAFLGIADSGSYMSVANGSLYDNIYDPAGYPLFMRLVHLVSAKLTLLIVVQHALGVATAAILYVTVRRLSDNRALAIVPAIVVLFNGYGIWVEHTPLTEALFGFLVASVLCLLSTAATERFDPRLAVVGLLLGYLALVRPAGLVLFPVTFVWLLAVMGDTLWARVRAVLVVLVPACAIVLVYAAEQQHSTGVFGLNQDSGRVVYARAAKFADCSKFTPPAGTAGLCEKTPKSSRGSFNQYLTNYPDFAPQPGAPKDVSPAWRLFGPPPGGESKLRAFGRQAMLHQPLDYVDVIASDFKYYWKDDHGPFFNAAKTVFPPVQDLSAKYYSTKPGVSVHGLSTLRWFGDWFQLTGPTTVVWLFGSLLGFAAARGARRRAAVLFLLAGWAIPFGSVATASIDPRFVLPASGPLAASLVLGLSGLWALSTRLRDRSAGEPATAT